jgi:hypothetical protein
MIRSSVRIERQIDVIQNLAVSRIGLGQTLHVIDELTGHIAPGFLPCPLFAPMYGKLALM